MVDKRTTNRAPLHIEVITVCKRGRFKMESRNVSLGGMLLESSVPFELEEEVQLQFFLPAPKDILVTMGRVKWALRTTNRKYLIGVSFNAYGMNELFALRAIT